MGNARRHGGDDGSARLSCVPHRVSRLLCSLSAEHTPRDSAHDRGRIAYDDAPAPISMSVVWAVLHVRLLNMLVEDGLSCIFITAKQAECL